MMITMLTPEFCRSKDRAFTAVPISQTVNSSYVIRAQCDHHAFYDDDIDAVYHDNHDKLYHKGYELEAVQLHSSYENLKKCT